MWLITQTPSSEALNSLPKDMVALYGIALASSRAM